MNLFYSLVLCFSLKIHWSIGWPNNNWYSTAPSSPPSWWPKSNSQPSPSLSNNKCRSGRGRGAPCFDHLGSNQPHQLYLSNFNYHPIRYPIPTPIFRMKNHNHNHDPDCMNPSHHHHHNNHNRYHPGKNINVPISFPGIHIGNPEGQRIIVPGQNPHGHGHGGYSNRDQSHRTKWDNTQLDSWPGKNQFTNISNDDSKMPGGDSSSSGSSNSGNIDQQNQNPNQHPNNQQNQKKDQSNPTNNNSNKPSEDEGGEQNDIEKFLVGRRRRRRNALWMNPNLYNQKSIGRSLAAIQQYGSDNDNEDDRNDYSSNNNNMDYSSNSDYDSRGSGIYENLFHHNYPTTNRAWQNGNGNPFGHYSSSKYLLGSGFGGRLSSYEPYLIPSYGGSYGRFGHIQTGIGESSFNYNNHPNQHNYNHNPYQYPHRSIFGGIIYPNHYHQHHQQTRNNLNPFRRIVKMF